MLCYVVLCYDMLDEVYSYDKSFWNFHWYIKHRTIWLTISALVSWLYIFQLSFLFFAICIFAFKGVLTFNPDY